MKENQTTQCKNPNAGLRYNFAHAEAALREEKTTPQELANDLRKAAIDLSVMAKKDVDFTEIECLQLEIRRVCMFLESIKPIEEEEQ